MFSTIIAAAALAGSLANAAPVARASQPSTYYTPYLEPYAGYHLRYLALSCQTQHNTDFFDKCCHPLLSSESLSDRPGECTPSDSQVASASAYIASTAQGGPTAAAGGDDTPAATATTTADPDEVSQYSAAQATASTTSTADSNQNDVAHHKTSSSDAAAPTSSSSSDDSGNNNGGGSSGTPSGANTGGFATFFYQGGNAGACGDVHSDSDKVIAIDQDWWGGNFGQESQYCGKWITLQNTNNGKQTTAMVADVCPTCANSNSLDLSVGAFNDIASEGEGMVPITWWFD